MVLSPLNEAAVLIRKGLRAKRFNPHTEFHFLWSLHPSKEPAWEGMASSRAPVCLYSKRIKPFLKRCTRWKHLKISLRWIRAQNKNPKFSLPPPFLVRSNTNNRKRSSRGWYMNSSGWSKIALPQLLQSWTNKLSRLNFYSSKASPFKQNRPLLLQQI